MRIVKVPKGPKPPRHRPYNRVALMEVVRVGYAHGIAPGALAALVGRSEKVIRLYAERQGIKGPGAGRYQQGVPSPVPHDLLVSLVHAGIIRAS